MLEPYEAKVSRTVLRRGRASNRSFLFGDALISLGMNRYVARTLAYLQNVDEATAMELEKGAGLHQPEVSIAMKELKERGWINEREAKKLGKGRPYKIYSLKNGLKEIVSHLEKQQKQAVGEALEKIYRLREIDTRSIIF